MLRMTTALGLTLALAAPVAADEVNVYTARHYDSDLALYDAFTAETGITVNIIEGSGDEILERIVNEGINSPADVLITVDGGRLHRAVEAGVLSPIDSDLLEARIPERFQHPDNLWFGLTSRARVIFTRAGEAPEWLDTYEDLADERLAGEICIRTSSNIYNVSLMAELIELNGVEAAENWARGVAANLARQPQGGDTDQLRALAAGECAVAVSNTYYFGRLRASDNPADAEVGLAIEPIFPDQDGNGTHVNISGAGVVATAPNRANGIRLIEFLTSDAAQQALADGNNEYPVVEGVTINGPIAAYADFVSSETNVAVYGLNAAAAIEAYDRAMFP